jgi:hypothetical protein
MIKMLIRWPTPQGYCGVGQRTAAEFVVHPTNLFILKSGSSDQFTVCHVEQNEVRIQLKAIADEVQ